MQKVLKYRHFIAKMPIFIKLIDFTNHHEIKMCYDEFKQSFRDVSPEEALALLDGQFGDFRVRIFAVEKLSILPDYRLALIMPDTASALSFLHGVERSECQQERLRGMAICDRDGQEGSAGTSPEQGIEPRP